MNNLYFLLIIVLTINLYPVSKNWYVSTASSGNASGDNWANSKAYWSLNTATLSPGDTVFFDGGTDSLEYTSSSYSPSTIAMMIQSVGTAQNKIVFTRGKDAGHNGVPVFKDINKYVFYFANAQYVELSYIKAVAYSTLALTYKPIVIIYGTTQKNIDIIHNEFDYTYGTAIQINSGDNIKVNNNYIYTNALDPESAEFDIATIRQNDAVTLKATSTQKNTGLEIAYNTIIAKTSIPTNDSNPHRDIFQFNYLNIKDGGTSSIHHNFVATLFEDDSCRTTFFECPDVQGTVLIYNNVFAKIRNGSDLFNFDKNNDYYPTHIKFFNNTMISTDSKFANPQNSRFSNEIDSVTFKNNLVYNETGYFASMSASSGYKDFDYNIYEFNGTSFASDAHWTTWTTTYGQDANSQNGDFTLVDNDFTTFSETVTDYMLAFGSSGIDEGTDLSSIFNDDYAGTNRPVGVSWDVGAFEYFENSSSNINLRGKLLLQGPFNSNSMITNLSQNGLLPNAQPFNSVPWNYNGSESLGSSSTSSYVDWILVELRNSSNPAQVVDRKAAILKNDGTLLNTDGSTGVPFSNVQEGSYYIAIFHKNHLAIMSADPVQLSANSQIYDFTTGINKAYGTNSMADLGNGIFGMYAGDGNSNGGITIADRNEVWLPQNGTLGYLNGDFNLDGGVTIHDVNLYWNINNGTMTQVP